MQLSRNQLIFWHKNSTYLLSKSDISLLQKRHYKMMKAAPSERNKEPILSVLKRVLPTTTPLTVLEIASGTGQHVAYFAPFFQNIMWQPSDIDQRCIESIKLHISNCNLTNVRLPIYLDISQPVEYFPKEICQSRFDVIYCANMIHIAPWSCTLGLFAAAGRMLQQEGGLLITYGPYAIDGVLIPESNVNFDKGLRRENPSWGIRDTRDLKVLANQNAMQFVEMFDMPANNKVLIFKKT